MRKIISYAVDLDTGLFVSRVGDEFAWPILDYDGMGPENNFTPTYYLERIPVLEAGRVLLKYTRNVPLFLKNEHRKFWGLRPLKDVSDADA